MTSVQDYLRDLRAARKEFVNKATNEASPIAAAPAAAVSPAIASSPWLKSPVVTQSATAAPRSDLSQREPAAAARQGAARATSTPLKPSQSRPRGPSVLVEDPESDTDTDISHLIDQLSLKSAPKPPPAPPSTSVGTAAGTAALGAGAPPRRGSKMDMLRRKFSASSPTKSWTDLGSSGGAVSLGRVRTRSRSSVSILDQKIILSGISGDEDSSGSSSSSEGTSSSSPIRTESAPATRRSRRSGSSGEVSERIEGSGVASVVPTVPSASSVQTETAPTAESVETESVETEEPTQRSVQTEEPTEESVETEGESTLRSVSETSVKSKQARTVRSAKAVSKSESESDMESETESESESEPESGSESESSVVAVRTGAIAESSESTLLGAAAGRASARDQENDLALIPGVKSHGKRSELLDSTRSDRRASKQEAKRQGRTERSVSRPSKQHRPSMRLDRSPDNHVRPDATSTRHRDRHTKRASRHRDEKHPTADKRPTRGSRSHRRAKEASALEEVDGAELVSLSGRRRRRRNGDRDGVRNRDRGRDLDRTRDLDRERDQYRERDRHRVRERDASWPELEMERTDASESLVVSYQRRVARSTGGCRHCRRQAWPPPPPVTVVVPPAALSGGVGGGVGEAVRLSTAGNSTVFIDPDEDAALSAILTQQVVLTRHFLATQKHLHEMYRRALRETQRQVFTHRDDLKGSSRRRWRRRGVPPD